jgi:hypothetical protein
MGPRPRAGIERHVSAVADAGTLADRGRPAMAAHHDTGSGLAMAVIGKNDVGTGRGGDDPHQGGQ